MKHIVQWTGAAAAILLLTVSCGYTMPTAVELKSSPDFQVPAGVTAYKLSDVLDLDEFLGAGISESFAVELNQADLISDFGMAGANVSNIPELPDNQQVSFVAGADGSDPNTLPAIAIGPIEEFTEIEFESGTLRVPMDFSGLSAGVEVTVSGVQIVNPGDGNAVVAAASQTELIATQAAPNIEFSFDMIGVVLPDEFAFEMVFSFNNHNAGDTFEILVTPALDSPVVARASGIDFAPISDNQTYNDLSFDLPEWLDSARIESGELLIGISTPDGWTGLDIDLNATLNDSDGNPIASDTASGTDPQIALDLGGIVFDGSALSIDWGYTVGGTNSTVTFTNGIAEVSVGLDFSIDDLVFVLSEPYQWQPEPGQPLFKAEDDLFGRDAVDDENVQSILDSLDYGAVHLDITNGTGLGLEVRILDGSFQQSINFGDGTAEKNETVELTSENIDYFKQNFFLPEIQLWLPQGELRFNPEGELSVGLWLELRTNQLEYTFPLNGDGGEA